MSSINCASSDMEDSKVVELEALKTITPEPLLCQSTVFTASTACTRADDDTTAVSGDAEAPRPQSSSTFSESTSELSDSSAGTVSTASSSNLEEHRSLMQSLTSLISEQEHQYSSFCSDSELSTCSTFREDASYCSSTFTKLSSSWSGGEEDYSDDDGHYKLIQLPASGEDLEFWPQSMGSNSNSDISECEDLLGSAQLAQYVELGRQEKQQELERDMELAREQLEQDEEELEQDELEQGLEQEELEEKGEEEEWEFCVQCHAWPEVEDCRDPPRNYHKPCYHTKTDPLECAFEVNVHASLSLVGESPIAASRRKAMESVLRGQFYILVQQFSVNPEKVARTLYGISVIDIVDLGIATAHALPAAERATVLAVTLVRRLMRYPDLFGDVCKVLADIPAMQEANAKARQLLYEECSEDQYSLLLKNGQHLSANNSQRNEHQLSLSTSNPGADTSVVIEVESHQPSSETSSIENERHNIVAQDSVSYHSSMSEGVDPDTALNEKAKCTQCSSSNDRGNLRLHESCLENRSIRSLDALMEDKEIDIDTRDKNGRTPLLVACLCLPTERKNERICFKQRKKIKSLLANGADSSIQDYDGNTALHIASLRRDQEVLRLLLNRSYIKQSQYFNVAVTNKNSRTALHYACYWGDMGLVMPLLEFEKEAKSGLVGVRDRNGDTGLHIASRGGFKPIVRELLKANADKDIKNKDLKSPADLAEEAKHNGIAKLLRRKKSRWLFHRKRPAVPDEQPDGGGAIMQRTPSVSSIGSVESNQPDNIFDLEASDLEYEESD